MEFLLGVLLLGIVVGIAVAVRANWGEYIGHGFGKRQMEEFGVDDDKKEYHE